MIEDFIAFRYNPTMTSLDLLNAALSIAALCVSMVLFVTREKRKDDDAEIRSKLRNVELETADLVDRLSTWQRRDASRQRRIPSESPDVGGGLFPDQHGGRPGAGNGLDRKTQLRSVARSRGLMP